MPRVALFSGDEAVGHGLDPQDAAGLHPLWAADMDAFGPWSPDDEAKAVWGSPGPLLASEARTASPVLVLGRTGSTQDAAWALARCGGLAEWSSVLAARQDAGRGQLRRAWDSPPGNLHASLALPGLDEPGWDRILSMVLGWCVLTALEEIGFAGLRIKWPNDLLQNDRKVGGLLLEERGGRRVLGLGLNLAHAPDDERMRRDFAVSAGVLEGPPVGGPLGLWCALVNRVKLGYLRLLRKHEPETFLPLVAERLSWLGRRILVREGERETYEATVAGLTGRGELLLLREGRETALASGSILPLGKV